MKKEERRKKGMLGRENRCRVMRGDETYLRNRKEKQG